MIYNPFNQMTLEKKREAICNLCDSLKKNKCKVVVCIRRLLLSYNLKEEEFEVERGKFEDLIKN